jgi:hypothetical protein
MADTSQGLEGRSWHVHEDQQATVGVYQKPKGNNSGAALSTPSEDFRKLSTRINDRLSDDWVNG